MAPGKDAQTLHAEMKRLQERVRELEGKVAAMERLASGAPIGLAIVDRSLRYTFMNERVEQLHGCAPGEWRGRTIAETAREQAPHIEPLYRKVIETGQTLKEDLSLPLTDGTVGQYAATFYPLRDSDAGITGACAALRDVASARTAEAELRASERMYRQLAESLSEFVWSEDANGRVEYANLHALRYCGLADGFDWRAAIHPEDAGRLRAELEGLPEAVQIEARIRRASDGAYRWHLVRMGTTRDDPSQVRVLGTAIDIHGHKLEEQARKLLAAIVESASDSIIALDLEGRITSWNPAAEKLFGYRAEDVIGKPAAMLTGSQTEKDVRDLMQRVARGETVESHETIRKAADGRELQVFVSLAPIRDESGSVIGGFKTVRDVTDQRQAERNLRAATERFRLAQKALRAALWELEPETGKAQWSPEVYELAGIDPSEIPSLERWLSRVHPDDAPRTKRNIARAIDRAEDLRHQFRIVRNGQIRWVTSFAQMVTEPGRPARLIGITMDTTDLHAAEEAFRSAARLESISRLAGGVAHDFNNLLAGIMGGASFIAEVLPESHAARTMLDLIVRSSERAAQLTRQLLAYSGQGTFAPRRFDFSRAVQESCSLLRGSMPPRLELEVQTAWDLPQIEADPNQIREVVLGLLSNAIEAIGDSAGSVFVRTGFERLDRAAIAARFAGSDLAPGSYLYLEVQDTGPGMTQDIVNRIFEPFFTTKFMGRGLGLSAIQGIVRGHRGAIDVETRPGMGARFRVYFPIATATAEIETERANEQPRSTVLVIDDEQAVREVVHAALSRAGFSVITAADGVAGLEAFRSKRQQISLVILDVSMPKMSGAEVLAELRKTLTPVKVVITSGYPEAEAMTRIPRGDIMGFLQKPFTVKQLSGLIGKVLGEGAAAAD